MKCTLCNGAKIIKIHQGCRDNQSIGVLKCSECGLVFLDSQSQVTDAMYEDFGVNQGADFDYKAWLGRTYQDDFRRAKAVSKLLTKWEMDKESIRLCDFGCGNGGFFQQLQEIGGNQFTFAGVELKRIAREGIEAKGVPCKKDIVEYQRGSFDVITMFHVVEHLTQPEVMLRELGNYLAEDGIMIIETPNADEALITRYQCEAYADFTYWSEHVYLYTSDTLAALVEKAGFQVIDNTQVQRYSVLNHMHWLAKGKPGGHKVLEEYHSPELDAVYTQALKQAGQCDTLLITIKKR